MTLPDERFRAVTRTEEFLKDLCDSSKTPRVPKYIRQQALWCLRHYPSSLDLSVAAKAAPGVFAESIEDVERLIMKYEQGKKNEA